MKAIVLGDRGVGKSTLIQRLCGAQATATPCGRAAVTQMTLPDAVPGDSQSQLAFWEVNLEAPAELFVDADLILLAYDVTSMRSFEQVTTDALPRLQGVRSALLVGLKSDQAVNRTVTVAQAHTWAVTHKARLVEVSADTGLNLDQLHRLVMLARAAPPKPAQLQPTPQIPMFMQSLSQSSTVASKDEALAALQSPIGCSSSFHSMDLPAPGRFAVVDDKATMDYLDLLCSAGAAPGVRVDSRKSPRESFSTVFRASHQAPWDASTRLGNSEGLWQKETSIRPHTARTHAEHSLVAEKTKLLSPQHSTLQGSTVASRLKSSAPRTARVPSPARGWHQSRGSPAAQRAPKEPSAVEQSKLRESHLYIKSPRPAHSSPRAAHSSPRAAQPSPRAAQPSPRAAQPSPRQSSQPPRLVESLQDLLRDDQPARPVLLRIELDLGGRTELLDVREGDKPAVLAESFVHQHSLAPAIIPRLAALIDQRASTVPKLSSRAPRAHPSPKPRSSPRASQSSPRASQSKSAVHPFQLATTQRAEASRRGASAMLKLHIQISAGRSGTIIVRKGDDPRQLSRAFVDTFKLNECMVETICRKIMEQLKLLQPKAKLPKLDFSQLGAPVVTPPSTPKPIKETLFNLDLDMGSQGAARLVVRRGDNPEDLAAGFVQQHGLQPDLEPKLLQLIQQQLGSMAASTPR